MPPRRYKRKGVRKPRRRVPRNPNGLNALARSNYCRLSESRQISASNYLITNTMYVISAALSPGAFLTSASPRALEVAKNFQEFRIRRFMVRVKPFYDTFTNTSATSGAPQLYMYANRDGDAPNGILGLLQQGINPRTLATDKNYTLSVRPSVVVQGELGANIIKYSPWLNTNKVNEPTGSFVPNATPHYGVVLFAKLCDTSGGAAPLIQYADLEVEIEYEFRRPMYSNVNTDPVTLIGV